MYLDTGQHENLSRTKERITEGPQTTESDYFSLDVIANGNNSILGELKKPNDFTGQDIHDFLWYHRESFSLLRSTISVLT